MLSQAQAAQLVEHFGGQRAASRATEVAQSTIAHWLEPERRRRYYLAHAEEECEYSRRYFERMYWGTDTPETNHKHFVFRSKRGLRSRRHKALQRRAERQARRSEASYL